MLKAPAKNEQIWAAYVLRTADKGWKMSERREFFDWFHAAEEFHGGHSFPGYMREFKADALSHLSASDKRAVADVIKDRPLDRADFLPPRPFVKELHDGRSDADPSGRDAPSEF